MILDIGGGRPAVQSPALQAFAQDVIRHLALWATSGTGARVACRASDAEADTDRLCAALIGLDPRLPRRLIDRARTAGATHEDLCLCHIGAAATQLGVLWTAGRLAPAEMALAAGRMLQLLRDLRDLAPPFEPRRGRSALFATVPGEAHVLGVTVAADLMRDAGWEVALRLGIPETEIAGIAQREAYPIVGLSAAGTDRIPALGRTILALRLAAPKVQIFVGGALARTVPGIAGQVGADASGHDFDTCRAALERMHAALPRLLAAG